MFIAITNKLNCIFIETQLKRHESPRLISETFLYTVFHPLNISVKKKKTLKKWYFKLTYITGEYQRLKIPP